MLGALGQVPLRVAPPMAPWVAYMNFLLKTQKAEHRAILEIEKYTNYTPETCYFLIVSVILELNLHYFNWLAYLLSHTAHTVHKMCNLS